MFNLRYYQYLFVCRRSGVVTRQGEILKLTGIISGEVVTTCLVEFSLHNLCLCHMSLSLSKHISNFFVVQQLISDCAYCVFFVRHT